MTTGWQENIKIQASYLPEKQHQALNKAAKIVMTVDVCMSRFQHYVTKHLYKQNDWCC